VNGATDRALARRNPLRHGLAAWGPGLLVMLADTDAGNVVAAAQAGAQWNFRLLPLVLDRGCAGRSRRHAPCRDRVHGLASIGEIGESLAGALGRDNALLVFSVGVVGASFAAAIVASLALSWGMAEVFPDSGGARRFLGLYAAGLCGAAALVRFAPDLVWLNIAAQAANALLFPLVVGLLIALTAKVLEPSLRLRGVRYAIMIVLAASVGLIGLIGAAAAFF
jgi:Mn2+/Fe2+ NRAMP family transporter